MIGLAWISCWIAIRSRERLCDHVGSADAAIAIVSNFTTSPFSASIWLVSRDTVPKQITLSRLTMAARYTCTVLVSVGTRHCAQCVYSMCSYLGDKGHNAGSVGNQSQTPHSACVRRPITFPTATDCRLYHRACLLSEWDDIPGVATPRLHACKTDSNN